MSCSLEVFSIVLGAADIVITVVAVVLVLTLMRKMNVAQTTEKILENIAARPQPVYAKALELLVADQGEWFAEMLINKELAKVLKHNATYSGATGEDDDETASGSGSMSHASHASGSFADTSGNSSDGSSNDSDDSSGNSSDGDSNDSDDSSDNSSNDGLGGSLNDDSDVDSNDDLVNSESSESSGTE